MSAATHELKTTSGRDLTPRFRAVLEHYGMRSSRITPGRAHENGVAEQAHRRLKALVAQALLVRGHAAFDDVPAYDAFVQGVVAEWRNRSAAARLAEERAALGPLPSAAIPSYTSYYPVVRRWSTIRVAHRTYSVPAQLMGHTVEARVHHAGRLRAFRRSGADVFHGHQPADDNNRASPGGGRLLLISTGKSSCRHRQFSLTSRSGCTVIGQMHVHQVEASELLCTDTITVDDLQSGCVRFSAFPPDSQVPRAFRSQALTNSGSLFSSTRFGDSGYAQLSSVAPDEIVRGGENGTEIGAFNTLLNPIKLDSLRAKVDEFLPFGLIPLFITET